MICRYCKQEMTKDDCDFQFKGCYDDYWICENCHSSCIQEIRFFKLHKSRWWKSENRP